ncbi:MAG: hypothetical protein ABIN89_23710 [Chitinophagaceae bacterium]
MIPSIREAFNSQFTEEKYNAYLKELNSLHPGAIEFRIAETPVFVPKDFTQKMLDACDSIIDVIVDPKFKELTKNSIPVSVNVPGENSHSHFIAFDFGVCEDANGALEPQLIEMQGFPTMFAFQAFIPEVVKHNFIIPGNFDSYLGGFDKTSYIKLLKDIIVADCEPEQVILLELFPHKQKTRIDFYCTWDYLDIQAVCLTELIKEGEKLYYINEGKKTEIKRIYNRIIFDDLQQQSAEVQEKGKLMFETLDVEWVPHPNWFYRISKYTLPFIRSRYVPPTFFLHEIEQIPADLENYVLKPLFSFAGQGVVIDVSIEDIQNVKDPENWILQRKVKYADVIKTPDIPAKAEIRLFYFWKDGDERPVPTNNLARLSKGKMIGVRYNKDKEWVGGTLCFFEK